METDDNTLIDIMVTLSLASIENILPFCRKHFLAVAFPVIEHNGVVNVTGTYVGDDVVGFQVIGLDDEGVPVDGFGGDVGKVVVGLKLFVGIFDGLNTGEKVGTLVVGGRAVGFVGFEDGLLVGINEGIDVGLVVGGIVVGRAVGLLVVGESVRLFVVRAVGLLVVGESVAAGRLCKSLM